MGAVIEIAVNWAVKIANDNSHGYDQNSRWGPNYDCSSIVISAFEQAGCKVKSGGATYTGNMKSVFLRYGFSDVTSKIALSTGMGLKRGDVLLNTTHHTALVVEDGGNDITSYVGNLSWQNSIYGLLFPSEEANGENGAKCGNSNHYTKR